MSTALEAGEGIGCGSGVPAGTPGPAFRRYEITISIAAPIAGPRPSHTTPRALAATNAVNAALTHTKNAMAIAEGRIYVYSEIVVASKNANGGSDTKQARAVPYKIARSIRASTPGLPALAAKATNALKPTVKPVMLAIATNGEKNSERKVLS
jgi:hypothetical protein